MPRRNRKPFKVSGPSRHRNPGLESGQGITEIATGHKIRGAGLGAKETHELIASHGPEELRSPQIASEPKGYRNPINQSGERERIRALVEVYYDVQDVRIRSFNRLRTVGKVEGVRPQILKELEKQIKDYISVSIRDVPIVKNFLRNIRGIGPILAGGLISYLDPHEADHASSFWKFCGMHVVDSKAPKRVKGKKLGFNVKMRTLIWKVADSFIKHRTPFYRDIYDETKVKEANKLGNPDVNGPKACPLYPDNCDAYRRITAKSERTMKGPKKLPCAKHIDYRARRRMVKRFLADLWAAWRSLEGLPVTEPYAIAILKHSKGSDGRE